MVNRLILLIPLLCPVSVNAQFQYVANSDGKVGQPATDQKAGGLASDDIFNMALEQLAKTPVVVPSMDIPVTSVMKEGSTVGRSAAAVFVITNEMIRRSGATCIPEALRMAPAYYDMFMRDDILQTECVKTFDIEFQYRFLLTERQKITFPAIYPGVYPGIFTLHLGYWREFRLRPDGPLRRSAEIAVGSQLYHDGPSVGLTVARGVGIGRGGSKPASKPPRGVRRQLAGFTSLCHPGSPRRVRNAYLAALTRVAYFFPSAVVFLSSMNSRYCLSNSS